jgi:hypothetical protein
MTRRSPSAALAAAAATLALTSCGGGDGSESQQVAVTEFAPADQPVLAGDWPLDATTRAFLVQSADEWQQAWVARKAVLNCEAFASYNAPACQATSPPAVDFSRYAVVGLLLNPVYYFVAPSPARVALEGDGSSLVVEYRYANSFRAPFFHVTGTRFFLVPRADARLKARATEN